MNRACIIAFFLLGGIATSAFAAETSLGKFTLAGGEKRTITVESTTPLKVGYANESTLEEIKSCRKSCIQISVVGDPFSVAAASVGTTIGVKLTGGKAEIVFENLEAFPITISVFRQ
jgi:hypothetical protein